MEKALHASGATRCPAFRGLSRAQQQRIYGVATSEVARAADRARKTGVPPDTLELRRRVRERAGVPLVVWVWIAHAVLRLIVYLLQLWLDAPPNKRPRL